MKKDPTGHKVTIYDIARESGVSYSTVSRVLNGFEFVKDVTREKVLEAAERLGYVANLQARSLAGGRSNVVGLLVPKIDNSYVTEIAAGIDDELAKANLNMILYTTHRHTGKEHEYVKSIAGGMMDGMLLLVPLAINAYLETLHERHFPHVLIDQHDPSGISSEVMGQNYEGAYQATEYLIQLGHRHIAFITGLLELHSTHERLRAYKMALNDHGIPYRPEYVLQGDFYEIEAYRVTGELLALPEPPTAIFASNDLTAIGSMNALRDHGISVPDDISVIGFDDISQAAFTNPRLTTIRQPLDQMGRKAVELLIEQIENPERPSRRITLATELVVRDSCQPPE